MQSQNSDRDKERLPTMSKPNQLRAGVIMTYINLVLGCLIPMFYTPVMLRLLGQSEYGLLGLAQSITSYLSLLSFGLGSTIIRYLSIYRADNDKDGEERVIGLFIAIYCCISTLVLIGGWILSCYVEPIFHKGLTDSELAKIKVLIRLMALNMALSFPISVFGSVIVAHERYIYRQAINIFSNVAAPIANLVALYLGYASIGMTLAGTFMQILMLPLYTAYCAKQLGLHPKFKRMPGNLITEILGFSLYVFIGSIVDMLFWATDKVILGMEASTAAIAVYNIGVTFNSMFTNLSTAVSGVLQPKVTIMVKQNTPKSELSAVFIKVGRLQYALISLALSGFIVFGQAFLRKWAGNDYSDSYWIALVTLIPLTVPLIQNTGISIVMAQNKHKFRSLTYLAIAVVNVISTYLLVPYLGGFGAALCSGVSYIIGQGVIMNIYYYRVTGIDIPAFWRNILHMSIVPVIMLGIGLLLGKNFDFGKSWGALLAGIIVYTILFSVGSYFISFNAYEKDIVNGVFRKLRRRAE